MKTRIEGSSQLDFHNNRRNSNFNTLLVPTVGKGLSLATPNQPKRVVFDKNPFVNQDVTSKWHKNQMLVEQTRITQQTFSSYSKRQSAALANNLTLPQLSVDPQSSIAFSSRQGSWRNASQGIHDEGSPDDMNQSIYTSKYYPRRISGSYLATTSQDARQQKPFLVVSNLLSPLSVTVDQNTKVRNIIGKLYKQPPPEATHTLYTTFDTSGMNHTGMLRAGTTYGRTSGDFPLPDTVFSKRNNSVLPSKTTYKKLMPRNKGSSVPKRRPSIHNTESKKNPARILSKQAETLLDRFRRRVGGASNEDDNSDDNMEFSISNAGNGAEQIEKIVCDNRNLYVTKYQPKSLKRDKQLTPLKEKEVQKGYKMPDNAQLRNSFRTMTSAKKQRMMMELSNNQIEMEGMLNIKFSKTKTSQNTSDDKQPIIDYMKSYGHVAENICPQEDGTVDDFAAALQMQIKQNLIKVALSDAIKQKMKQAASQRRKLEGLPTIRDPLDRLNTNILDTKGIQAITVADAVKKMKMKLHYGRRFKQRNIEDNFEMDENSLTGDKDPIINYYKSCLQSDSTALPIFDHIVKKTLLLRDYKLNLGQVEGLAIACEYLDHTDINRICFDNCGINGDSFAIILDGVRNLKDFKAFTLRLSPINSLTIDKLTPLLERRIPHHLEELNFIDCRISSTLIEQLIDTMMKQSQIKKFALCQAQHSERSWNKLIQYIDTSCFLKELDLSWSSVRPQMMLRLLDGLRDNCTLVSLNLSYNHLLEEQPEALTVKQLEAGQTEVELSKFNLEVVSCFSNFIKQNVYLAHLDLQQTGLIEPALKYMAALLRKAQSLSCLHLCGNKMTDETIEWIRTRIHAKAASPQHQIVALKKQKHAKQIETTNPLLKIMQAKQTIREQHTRLQEGVQMRQIQKGRRLNSHASCNLEQNFNQKKLIITRKLGFKELAPGAAQWVIQTEQRDECWFCNQSILTVFLWRPRVGQLSAIKENSITEYYDRAIQLRKEQLSETPGMFDNVPTVMGPFNNWEPVKMRNMVEFLRKNDPCKPDFIKLCVGDGDLKPSCIGQNLSSLPKEDQEFVNARHHQHYTSYWSRIIMQLIQYKNPKVINGDHFSSKSILNGADKTDPIFFHVDWVKPGKSFYAVQHLSKQQTDPMTNKTLFGIGDDDNEQEIPEMPKPVTYVHEMLVEAREEPVVRYVKSNIQSMLVVDPHPAKQVFRTWKSCGLDTQSTIFKVDYASALIDTFLPHEQEKEKVKTELMKFLPQLLDIFVYMQSLSSTYPLVSGKVVKEHFLLKMGDSDHTSITNISLVNIMIECCVQNKLAGRSKAIRLGDVNLNRSVFMEFIVRIAIYLYTGNYAQANHLERKSMTNLVVKSQQAAVVTEEDENYRKLSLSQALYILLESKLKPFYKKIDFYPAQFRENELWTNKIEKIYTVNEPGIKALFEKYFSRGQTWLTLNDCQRIVRDSELSILPEVVHKAFIMSKQIVVNESDDKQARNYQRMVMIEFLEFIGRLADLQFKDSELEDINLDEKIEFTLCDLLPLVDYQLQWSKIIIQEHSDSDDDY